MAISAESLLQVASEYLPRLSPRDQELFLSLSSSANTLHALMTAYSKLAPRYLKSNDGVILPDTLSSHWSVSYFRFLTALPHLRQYIKPQDHLIDPFAGSGYLSFCLSVNGLGNNFTCSDVRYLENRTGNEPKHDWYYKPDLNLSSLTSLLSGFSEEPHQLKQKFSFVYGDINSLNCAPNSFVWVVTDPPHNRNIPEGGIDFFIKHLPEMQRVSQKGTLAFIPQSWNEHISACVPKFSVQVEDLSLGKSEFATSLVKIDKCTSTP